LERIGATKPVNPVATNAAADISSLNARLKEMESQLAVANLQISQFDKNLKGMGSGSQLSGVKTIIQSTGKEVERTNHNLKVMLKSAEMSGSAVVKSLTDIGRAKNLVNNLELRVIKSEELGKLRDAEKSARDLARAKNLVNNLELRVIKAEELGKLKEAEKAARELARAKNLANSLELRVIKSEELAKLKESERVTSALMRAKNLANNLELRVIKAEELGKLKEAEKLSRELARAKNLANSLELRVIKSEELAKIKEAEKLSRELAQAKNLANNLELRVIKAEELGKLKEAERLSRELARAKNLANSLELRVIKSEELAKLKESERLSRELARAKNLANSLELRVIKAEELGKLKEAERLSRELARAKNLANSLELRVIKSEEVASAKALNAELALTAKYVAMSASSQIGSQIGARRLLDAGLSPAGAYSAQAIAAARAARSVEDLAKQKQRLAGVTGVAGWETKGFSGAQNALHSALRGVGGAMGALWLTYGKFVTVMIAAGAATKMAKDSFSAGLELNFLSQFVATVDTQGNAALSKLRELRNNIATEVIKVSEDSVFTTQENVQALQKLSLAGIEASRGIKLLGTATNAAVFGQTNLADATGMVLDTLYNFNMASNDAGLMADSFERVGNVMAYTAVTVNTTFSDLARAFQNITGVAGTFNIEIEEASALLQSLAEAGIRGQKAGTYVRNFLDDILGAPISQRAEKVFDSLGVERFNPENFGQFGVSQYIDELVSKLQKLDFIEQQNAIRAITNQRSRRVLRQELLKSYDDETTLLARVSEMAKEADGSLNRMSEGLRDTGRYALLMAQSAYNASVTSAFQNIDGDNIFADIGRTLQATFKSDEFKEIVTSFTNGVAEMLRAAANFFSTLVSYKDVVGDVFKAILSAGIVSFVLANLGKMSFAVGAFAASVITSLALIKANAIATFAAITAAAMANPITAALVLIGLSVAGGIALWQRYKRERDLALGDGMTSVNRQDAEAGISRIERQISTFKLMAQQDGTQFYDQRVTELEQDLKAARDRLGSVILTDQSESIATLARTLNTSNKQIQEALNKVRGDLLSDSTLSGNERDNREFEKVNELAKKATADIIAARKTLDGLRTARSQTTDELAKQQLASDIAAATKELADYEETLETAVNRMSSIVEKKLFANVPDVIKARFGAGIKALSEKLKETEEELAKSRFSDEQNKSIEIVSAESLAALNTSQALAAEGAFQLAQSAGRATDMLLAEANAAQHVAQESENLAATLRKVQEAKDVLAGKSALSAESLIGMDQYELQGLTDALRRQGEQAIMTAAQLDQLAKGNFNAAKATLEFRKATLMANGSSIDRIAEVQTQIDLINALAQQYQVTRDQVAAGSSGRGATRDTRSTAIPEVADVRKVADAEYKQYMTYVEHSKKVVELKKRTGQINEVEYQNAMDAIADQSINLGVQREKMVQSEIQAQLAKAKDDTVKKRLGASMSESVAKEEELRLQATLELDFVGVREAAEIFKMTRDHADTLDKLALAEQRTREEVAQRMAFEMQANPIRLAGDRAVYEVAKTYRQELEKIDELMKANQGSPDRLDTLVTARDNIIAQMQEQQVLARQLAEFDAERMRSFSYGWEQAFIKFNDDATNYAVKADDVFKTMSQGIQGSLETFFMNPTKEGFKGLLLSFVDMLRQMVSKAMAAKLTEALFNSNSGGNMLLSLASTIVGGSLGGTQSPAPVIERSFSRFADGGAFDNTNVTRFAKGGAFGNGEVLTQPTFFKFANGGSWRDGVAGEAGPEAALPLKRMANGKLGVHMDGGGASGGSSAPSNIRIVNAFDSSFIGEYMGSSDGEEVVLNIIKRNSTSIRSLVA